MFLSSLPVFFASLVVAAAWVAVLALIRGKQPETTREYQPKYGVWALGLGVVALVFTLARHAYDGVFGILCFWMGTHPVLDMTTLLFCGICGPLAVWLGIRSHREEGTNLWASAGIYCGAIPTVGFVIAECILIGLLVLHTTI